MNPARTYRAVFALVGWAALGLQFWLLLTTNPDKTSGELVLNFFSYFTVQVNILAALALTGPALSPDSRLGRWTAGENVRAAVAMYIAVVGIIYHFLLSHVWAPQGLSLIANGLLHYVMPAAMLLDWLVFTPKGRLRWIDALKWLVFPLLYGAWTLLHGALSGWYPYWFIDVGQIGLGRTAINLGGLLVFFLFVGLIVVAIDRTLGRRDRTAASA